MNPIFFPVFTIFFFCSGLHGSQVARISTIRRGDELNSTSFLTSEGGNFTLGFFTTNERKDGYLGIWYTNDDQQRRVWVANPNTPILNNSGVLTVDGSGILKITSVGGGTILNISEHVTTGNASARLEDSGNFVLSEEIENRTLWQSFDHPTDVLLPGMKLGFNVVTGKNWSLTSWLSYSFPASGAFTLSWEEQPAQESGQLVIHRRGERYWTSGVLKNQTFEFMVGLNDPSNEYHYNLSYVLNSDEKYFTYSAVDGIINPWKWQLTPDGLILDDFSYRHLSNYDVFCYGYGRSYNGCVSSPLPQCRSSNGKFEEKKAYFLPSNTSSHYNDNSILILSDCAERCWKDCSCVGFNMTYSNGTGCVTWTGKLEYREENNNSIYVLVLANSSKGKNWRWIVIAVAISLLISFWAPFAI